MTPAVTETPTKDCTPFLRWAGSKRSLLPILQTFWTRKHKRYIEPFAGSACLFFAIKPPKAILGDLNPELIATYIEVKYRIAAVLKELKSLSPANKEEYKRLRAIDISTLAPPARAARFIYLNRFCFNGRFTARICLGSSTFRTVVIGVATCRRMRCFENAAADCGAHGL